MKRLFVFGVCLSVLSGCDAKSPAAPSSPEKTVLEADGSSIPGVPLLVYHNIPATMPDGTVMWVCATQRRVYCKDGTCEKTIDHYIQALPCPDIPIE